MAPRESLRWSVRPKLLGYIDELQLSDTAKLRLIFDIRKKNGDVFQHIFEKKEKRSLR